MLSAGFAQTRALLVLCWAEEAELVVRTALANLAVFAVAH